MTDKTTYTGSKGRRKVLKTAGVTTGLAAGAAWHKPILKSVITPAHAQTSGTTTTVAPTTTAGPINSMVTGPTSGTDPFVMLIKQNQNDSIASKVMDAVMPEAHALAPSSSSFSGLGSPLLNDTGANYEHCVSVSVTAPANTTPTSATVSLVGPDIYYDYTGYQAGYSYYSSTVNFSGSMTASLTPNGNVYDFTVTINDIEVNGEIDNTLADARGTLTYIGSNSISIGPGGYAGFMNSPVLDSSNYGAYWEATGIDSCGPGSGPDNPVVVGTPSSI